MKSMTGYGRFEQVTSGYNIAVEIKSVNHRYFAFSPRIPRLYNYLEDKLKNKVHAVVARGEIDLYLAVKPIETTSTKVEINQPLAQSYFLELRKLGENIGIENDICLSHITKFNDIFVLTSAEVDQEFIWGLVDETATKAIEKYNNMRKAEGAKLKEDVLSRLEILDDLIIKVEEITPKTIEAWQNRLYEKMKEVLEDKQIDESRIVSEVAIFANKVAVDEEIVRLRSHLSQFKTIAEEDEAVGRKLDFLVQEINREVNTIGSKCQDAEAAKLVVDIKSEVEKIREQIQNIE